MKPRLFLLVCVYLFSMQTIKAQITQQQKQELINSLSIIELDSMFTLHYAPNAIQAIIEYIAEDSVDFQEAIPAIIDNIWKVSPYDQTEFLWALYLLKSPETEQLALAYIDSVDHYTDTLFTKLSLKILAAHTLFYLGNYSKYQLVFDELSQEKPEISSHLIYMLSEIIRNIPSEEMRAKNALIKIAGENNEDTFRYYSISDLAELYGEEMIPFFSERFINEEDIAVIILLYRSLKTYKDERINSAFKIKLPSIDEGLTREQILRRILSQYGTISDFKFVLDYQDSGIDPENNTTLNLLINDYKSPKPSPTTSLSAMLDELISLTDTTYISNWLTDINYKNELILTLQSARNYLYSSDSINCAKEIKSFQSSIQQVYADSAGSYPKYVSQDAYKFLYYYPQYILDRLPSIPTIKLKDSQGNLLPGGTLQYYEGGWKNATDNGDGTFTVDTQLKTVSLRMTYEYGSQTKSNVAVGADTVVFQTVNAAVKLQDSQNNLIPAPMGDQGTVQYYAGGWRNFGTTTNGIATKELLPIQYTFRMTYGFASNDKAQSLDTNSTVIFKTVSASVQLKDSQGNLIDQGTVQYYSGGWRGFGITVNGITSKELLPNNYTFRMSYGFASNDRQQNIGVNSLVEFQTMNAEVQLRDSQNNLIDQGTVQYYSGGWRQFGTTTNGIVNKELLPNNYTFRMNYGFASNDKQQNLNTNPTIIFQTSNTTVQLKDSQGNLIDPGTIQYYSGGWREFGTTTNGTANKELLPNNYTFRMSYAFASKDKQQNIGTNPLIEFQTINTAVQLRDSQNNLMPAPMGDQGTVQYYSGGWREFGTTSNGSANKELLANNYTFRMNYGFASNDKAQDINVNTTVVFQTVNTIVELRNSTGNFIDEGVVQYYSGGWRSFGTTTSGVVSKELLPNNYTFRMTHEFISNDKAQNVGTNNTVGFSTVLCTVRVRNAQNQPVDNAAASYYSGGWRQLGTTINGEVTKELLPVNLTFRINYGGTQQDKTQNLSTNSIVEFIVGQ